MNLLLCSAVSLTNELVTIWLLSHHLVLFVIADVSVWMCILLLVVRQTVAADESSNRCKLAE